MTGQAAFAAAILDPALAVPPGLTDPQGRPAPRRFDVYRNNVVVGLTRALEDGFPVIRRLVGDAFFAAMAQVFLRDNPPRSRMMMTYGAGFPTFLAGFPPVAHLPYLADVARLELALRHSYHAADAAPLDAAALMTLGEAALAAARPVLAPALRLIRSPHPIHAIWLANTSGGPPPRPGAEDVVVLRPGFDPAPHLLPPGGGAFLAALVAGEPFGAAAAGIDPTETLALVLAGGGFAGVLE